MNRASKQAPSLNRWKRPAQFALAAVVLAAAFTLPVFSQGGGAGKGKGGPPPTPRAQAPIDLTGYWVSLVTEDWLYRMVVPPKGDFASIPLNQEGQRVGNLWDPAESNSCKAYGAPGLMRQPGRLHIEWADDDTLQIETDAGTQTRRMEFNAGAAGAPSLQGSSLATWEGLGRGGRGTFGLPAGAGTGQTTSNAPGGPGPIRPGSLKVVTTNLAPGYLRRNGPPYSAETTVTEYYDVVHEPNGDQYLIVATIVEDPVYLTQPWRTSTHFRKEPTGSKFAPTACTP